MGESDHYLETAPTQDSNHEDDVIDTLSLSDFTIYENNGDAQEFYRLNEENPNDFDDPFEFSSELLINTSVNNSVVFCGKIIPYKDSNSIVSPNTQNLETKKVQKSHKQRWKLFKKSSKSKQHSGKQDLKCEVPIRKVSILASATKPRWYLLMFGFGSNNLSAEMHIRDLKKRHTSKNMMDDKISAAGGDDGGRGSWSLMRLLGCGGGGAGGGDGGHHPRAIKIIQEFGMRSLGQQVDV